MGAKPALSSTGAFPVLRADPYPSWMTSACMVAVDFLALSAVYWCAVLFRHVISSGYTLGFYLKLYPSLSLFLLAFLIQGLYPSLLVHPAEEMRRIFHGVTTVFLLLVATTFLWRNALDYSRFVFLATWACGIPSVLIGRLLLRRFFGRKSWWGVSAVLLGSGTSGARVARWLTRERGGLRLIGVLSEDPLAFWATDLPPVVGHLADAPMLATRRAAEYAIVVLPTRNSSQLREAIQEYCRGFRHILLVPDLPGLCSHGVTVRELGGEIGFEVPQRLFHLNAALTKRALDFCLSALAILAFSPIFLLIFIAIKANSKGPIFFNHARYGRDGRIFKALKFRSMVPNGNEVLIEHFRKNPHYLEEWQRDQKLRHDPRVTSVGRWLRRFSMDELPQLFNVLAGQMSLVGPRPIVKSEIAKYGSGYGLYQRVRPGLTGLWQVSGRNNTTYEERVAYDEYYVRNWSIWLDAYILARTIKAVLNADGAY